jgi:selenocysteine-specific elongation factor
LRVAANPDTPSQVPSHRVVIGTAGHIDHGKTQLVKALTGVDCDRWVEEKLRGITIDLGFAHLRDGDLQIGFVDVPGHEDFVHNALAGLGGIRVMLLVVASDEGVMPQTREHLAICSLLGIPGGLVVLTKKDLVSADLLELAELDVLDLLEGTPFAGSRIIPVSSVTGEGIADLKQALVELAARHETPVDESAPARLPIDRAFHLRGLGVVVTGTLASGVVHIGDVLQLLPAGTSVRVRSIQVHGTAREQASAGERTSLQVAGAALEELERGAQLVTPGAFDPSVRLCARFRLLPDAPKPLRGPVDVRLHLYSAQALGTLRPISPRTLQPGETGIVELRMREPVTAIRGDRFIVRRPSPQMTLGGGDILDPRWRRPKGAELDSALEALVRGERDALLVWIEGEGERGVDAESLAPRLGTAPERLADELEALARDGKVLIIPEAQGRSRRWLARRAYDRLVARARRVMAEYFGRDRLARGIPRAEAMKRIMPAVPAQAVPVYFSWLQQEKILALEGDVVVLPGRRVELSPAEAALAARVREKFETAGLSPPSTDQVRADLGADPKLFDGVIRILLQNGELLRLPGGSVIASAALDNLRRQLRGDDWKRFAVSRFKEHFGLTRKFAIPLLEHLDAIGFTRRQGEDRIVGGDS